jgi:hypothetical protein
VGPLQPIDESFILGGSFLKGEASLNRAKERTNLKFMSDKKTEKASRLQAAELAHASLAGTRMPKKGDTYWDRQEARKAKAKEALNQPQEKGRSAQS